MISPSFGLHWRASRLSADSPYSLGARSALLSSTRSTNIRNLRIGTAIVILLAATPGAPPSLRAVLSTAIDLDDTTASLDQALEVSPYFELEPGRTQRIAKEVAQAVALWRNEAAALGLTSAEVDRMSSAFEHDDLKAARRGS